MNREKNKQKIVEKAKAEALKEAKIKSLNSYLFGESEIAKKISKALLSDLDKVYTIMRQIKIFFFSFKVANTKLRLLKTELVSNVFVSFNKEGKVMCREEIENAILEQELHCLSALADIRSWVINKLVVLISSDEFSKERFEEYVQNLELELKKEGVELFPEEYCLISVK